MPIEFNSVVHRYSNTAGVVPTAAELYPGELALNLADGRLFTLNLAGEVIDITAINSKFSFLGAVDGYVLTYDAATGVFVPEPISATPETLWSRTDNTTATVGGIPSGTAGSTLVGNSAIQVLEKIMYPYVAPAFSGFSVSGLSNPFEIGQSFPASATATWTAGNPTANWINGTGYIDFTNTNGTTTTQAGPFNPTSNSQVVTFPAVTPPTSPVSGNTITITLKGSHNASNPTATQTSISRTWRSRMFFGKSSNDNLTSTTFDIATGTGSGNFLDTSSSSGPSNYSANVGAGAGYFYLFIHDAYTLSTAAPFFGLKYGGNALAQDEDGIATVSITNAYGVTSTYKRYKSQNIINDAITIVVNPTS